MKKPLKTAILILAVLILAAAVITGVILLKHRSTYISKAEALQIAQEDAGVSASEVIDSEADFEKTKTSAWYELGFETHTTEYEYHIDAVTGEILSSFTEPRD